MTGVHGINALGRDARSERNQETVKRGGSEHPWASLRRKPRRRQGHLFFSWLQKTDVRVGIFFSHNVRHKGLSKYSKRHLTTHEAEGPPAVDTSPLETGLLPTTLPSHRPGLSSPPRWDPLPPVH